MSSTVTAFTAGVFASTEILATFSLILIVTLVLFLIENEALSTAISKQAVKMRMALNFAMIPLLMGFALIATTHLFEVIH